MNRKILLKEFMRGFYRTVPEFEDRRFNEFLSRHLPTIKELKQKYGKNVFSRLFHGRKLKNVLEHEKAIEPIIEDWLRKDFDYIKNSTKITFHYKKEKLPHLNTEKIRETVTEVLYYMLLHERTVAEAKNQPFSLENFGLHIAVSFNPEKVGKPPSRPTISEQLAEMEEFATALPKVAKSLGIDEERLKRLKQLNERMEKLADEANV